MKDFITRLRRGVKVAVWAILVTYIISIVIIGVFDVPININPYYGLGGVGVLFFLIGFMHEVAPPQQFEVTLYINKNAIGKQFISCEKEPRFYEEIAFIERLNDHEFQGITLSGMKVGFKSDTPFQSEVIQVA